MRGRAAASAIVAGAAYGCVPPPFVCSEDAACDLLPGGRCEAGRCNYDEAASTGPAADPSSGAGTGEGTEGSTGGPAGCPAWERTLALPGKATDVALAREGAAYVVGITSEPPLELRALRLDAAGEVAWSHAVDATVSPSVDDDTDLWARLFVHRPDELVVVYARRDADDQQVSVKTGPHVRHLAADGSGVVGERDELADQNQSLRAASMPDEKTLLLAGEHKDNLWYQHASLEGGVWSPEWADDPTPFTLDAGFDSPAIAQAVARASADEVALGGTWNLPDGDAYTAWLRRVALADGAVGCECEVESAGILALAPADDGGLFVAGFRQDTSLRSEAWIARLAPSCEASCPIAWEQSIPGAEADTYFGRAELVRDAVFALAPAPGGGVIAAGTLDREPWAARYDEGGAELWVMERGASSGAALAIAVSEDAACLTLVGSEKYGNYAERAWWTRRVALPP